MTVTPTERTLLAGLRDSWRLCPRQTSDVVLASLIERGLVKTMRKRSHGRIFRTYWKRTPAGRIAAMGDGQP